MPNSASNTVIIKKQDKTKAWRRTDSPPFLAKLFFSSKAICFALKITTRKLTNPYIIEMGNI